MSEDGAQDPIEGIAIIGMGVRFPGAADLDTYWRNLREGVESISHFSEQELLAAGVRPDELRDTNYVKARGILQDAELFDASFFGFTPREAETMDPQHRLFLEVAWEALEHAAYDPDTYDGAIGLFTGSNLTGYLIHNLAINAELVKRVGPLQIRIRNDKDFLGTLAAYKLNLKGPAINVQTACSTSAVATCLACQSLMSYQCDMALAGGVSVTVPTRSGYLYQEGVYAADGRCRAFDADAHGTVLGDGVGVTVLKRMEDALEDGDSIHAVITGFATNNDGSLKLDYTAPSVDGQAEVIATAQAFADVEPETVSYIEAHGTGTPLGDPIEVAALRQVFGNGSEHHSFCGLGSVKPNIGHLDAAAGVASLVKTVLALEHRELPPSLHCERPNPQLQLDESPFYVVRECQPWEPPSGAPRRAGVSSFGVGGTNAHLVLEEAPELESSDPARPWQLVVLSARSETALEATTTRLAEYLEQRPELSLADVAYTLQVGRRSFEHRRMLVCQSLEDAVLGLTEEAPKRLVRGEVELGRPPSVAFLFSGIGDHYPHMGRELYDREPVFRKAVDQCCEILEPHLGRDLRAVLYPGAAAPTKSSGGPDLRRMLGSKPQPEDPAAALLDRTDLLHPAIFVVEYACAKLWLSWGIRPEAMLGYSIGEYTAACLAGTFSLADGLALVADRARVIQGLPVGSMLAVPLAEAEVVPRLSEELSLAAVNGPAFSVVAGPPDAIAELQRQLEAENITCRRLKAQRAFHSTMLNPALADFRRAVERCDLNVPEIPFLSNVTGTWITPEQATDPDYWVRHMCQTVRFGDGVRELWQDPGRVLLEVGPGQTLCSIALQNLEPSSPASGVALPTLPHDYDPQPESAFMLSTLGRLWLAGAVPDWLAFYAGERRHRLPLPGYPFERERYWIEPVALTAAAPEAPHAATLEKKPDPSDWFYLPAWRQSRRPAIRSDAAEERKWLLFIDSCGLGEALAERLASDGHEVVAVEVGERFSRTDERSWTLDPRRLEDYRSLLRALRQDGDLPRVVAHLWAVPPAEQQQRRLDHGFFSLLFFAQAWGEVARDPLRLVAVSSGVHGVSGEENLEPEKATVLGPCRVIPQEYATIACRHVDLPSPRAGESYAARWSEPLVAELTSGAEDATVALRGLHRWHRELEPVRVDLGEEATSRLRRGGVVLITGGLGGIGLTLADELAESLASRLVLTGRSEFPPREGWDAWLAEYDEDDATSNKIRRLRAMEAAGAEVLIVQADVTQVDQMERVKAATHERFGALHGIIHAAGEPPGGLIQLKSRETAAAVLAPKVTGTRVIEQVFDSEDLDFLLLCSSLTSVTGALGLVDHCAANAFLDAFAHHDAARRGSRTLSLNWDTWLEVGQAAADGMAGRLGALLATAEGRELDHPLLQRCREDGKTTIFTSHLRAGDLWILDEHRLLGDPLLPGTAYLEMARAAVMELATQDASEGSVVIREVTFTTPCRVPEGSTRELRAELERDGQGFRLRIASRDAEDGAGWQEHMRARLELGPAADESHDLQAVAERCTPRPVDRDPEEASRVQFGERWRHLIEELRCGDDEGWAALSLPERFHSDLDAFGLHPALLDAATGIARVLGEGDYLPLGYQRIVVRRPLAARVWSHFRLRPGDTDEFLVCDVIVVDVEGRELVAVDGYTMRRLATGDLAGTFPSAGAEPSSATPDASRPREDSLGMRPEEGREVLSRVLSQSLMEPQVVTSVHDLGAVLARIEGMTGDGVTEHLEQLSTPTNRHRRTIHTQYVAPRNELEESLAGLFQEMLGIEQVGIHDNFFNLGGNSLVATQLITHLRERFEVEVTLRAFFEAPTVEELGVVIVQEQAGQVDEAELAQALAELQGLSPEELTAKLAEESESEDKPRVGGTMTGGSLR